MLRPTSPVLSDAEFERRHKLVTTALLKLPGVFKLGEHRGLDLLTVWTPADPTGHAR